MVMRDFDMYRRFMNTEHYVIFDDTNIADVNETIKKVVARHGLDDSNHRTYGGSMVMYFNKPL
jgi:hypothetical protein